MQKTLDKIIDFYGGRSLWQQAQTIEATVSAHGLAFQLKRRPFFKYAQIQMSVHQPHSRLMPIGNNRNIAGILSGHDVYLENEKKEKTSERKNARSYFPGGRRLFWWDDLDMAYFANYAFWNYMTFPCLLMNKEIKWELVADDKIRGYFPKSIPTHSSVQDFIFDPKSGQLIQHNYVAEIISSMATAGNQVLAHASENGISYPSHRIVSPQKPSGAALGWPCLIELKIHKFKISNDIFFDLEDC